VLSACVIIYSMSVKTSKPLAYNLKIMTFIVKFVSKMDSTSTDIISRFCLSSVIDRGRDRVLIIHYLLQSMMVKL